MPSISARCVVTTQDRFIPPSVQRRVAAERPAVIEPDEIDAGHCANLGRPDEWPVSSLATLVERTQLKQRGTAPIDDLSRRRRAST
jgi:hypothetical protein